MWRRVALVAVSLLACQCGVLLGALLMPGSALAADLPPPEVRPPPPVAPAYKAPPPEVVLTGFYFGGALNRTHHTGYVPDTSFSAQQYAWGFKVFGGYRFTDGIRFEGAYHYLGKVDVFEGFPIWSTEQSYALSGSGVFMTPELSQWIGRPTLVPAYFFLRFGLAYKNINHVAVVGTFNEGILSGVFGGGFEFRPTASLFMRMEYEFLSTAIGGPPYPVPALNSLFNVSFGGTHRAINVMHTPLALTLGVYL